MSLIGRRDVATSVRASAFCAFDESASASAALLSVGSFPPDPASGALLSRKQPHTHSDHNSVTHSLARSLIIGRTCISGSLCLRYRHLELEARARQLQATVLVLRVVMVSRCRGWCVSTSVANLRRRKGWSRQRKYHICDRPDNGCLNGREVLGDCFICWQPDVLDSPGEHVLGLYATSSAASARGCPCFIFAASFTARTTDTQSLVVDAVIVRGQAPSISPQCATRPPYPATWPSRLAIAVLRLCSCTPCLSWAPPHGKRRRWR